MTLVDLIPTLQLATGPVILISGVGLLLLSMTNRVGRVIDLSRLLTDELDSASESDRIKIVAQLKILSSRARVVRAGITLASFSVLLAAFLIISLFLGVLFQIAIAAVIVTLFIVCMICLIISLLLFIYDTNLSLRALWLEIPPEGRSDAKLL